MASPHPPPPSNESFVNVNCTVKPVCNDHLYDKIYHQLSIQECVLMKTEGTNLLVLTISAF